MPDLGLTHVAVPVTDPERSARFYGEFAGMDVVHRRPGNLGMDVLWMSDRTRPFVLVLLPVMKVVDHVDHFGVACESVEEVDRRLGAAREAGFEVVGPIQDPPPVGYWGKVTDPDRHVLELAFGQEVEWAVLDAERERGRIDGGRSETTNPRAPSPRLNSRALLPRSLVERQQDVLQMLAAERDLWFATSGTDSAPYLVPLSFSWDGRALTLVSGAATPTMLNLANRKKAQAALGQTRDVVMIDLELESMVEVRRAPSAALQAYARQAGWTPDPWTDQVIAVVRPMKIQAWREANEIPGRTVMLDGDWRA